VSGFGEIGAPAEAKPAIMAWLQRLILPMRRLLVARVLGEAGWILAGQIAAAVGGIVGVPVLAHFLRPEEYGQLALGGTVALLVQQVTLGPVSNAAQRFYAASIELNTLSEYLWAVGHVVFFACALVAAIGGLALFGLAYSPWHHLAALAWWSMVCAILAGVCSVFDGIQNAARQRTIVAWHQGLGMWLRFAFAVLMVRFWGGAAMAMLGFAIAAAIVLISQVFFLSRAVISSGCWRPARDSIEERRFRRQLWVYARPFTTWGIFTWSQMASDRWALESFNTTRSVGLYQVLYQIGFYPIFMASLFLTQLVQPILFNHVGAAADGVRMQKAYVAIRNIFTVTLLATLVCTLAAALGGGVLFRHLLPPEYGSVAYLLPLMVLSSGLFACGQVASLKHALSTDPRTLIAPKIATAVLGTGLNFAGAWAFGIPGVAAASVCFSVTYCLWVVFARPVPCSVNGSIPNPEAAS
jgi:O-antigen/teichoic acid export membrane protein